MINMESMIESIFILAGVLIETLGFWGSIVVIGIAPLYVYGAGLQLLKTNAFSSRLSITWFVVSLILSLLIIGVLSIAGIVLGRWG